MNTKLVKILALSAVALSLGACGKKPTSQSEAPKAQEATIEEILEINADGNFALEGKFVSVDGLTIAGRYANTLIGVTALGETVNTLRGLQIDTKELPAFQKGSGWGCLISATGTLANVEGRAVLKDAEVTIKSEREYDENGKKVDGTGGDLYYWGNFSRSAFDNYIGRNMSGIMTEGVYQIASMPATVSGTAASSFQVVFPGEYADTEDPENVSLITVQIPEGVGDAGVKGINDYFKDKEVGDFIDMTALTQYDLTNNGGPGLLVESFMGQQFLEVEDAPEIYTTWDDVAASVQYLYYDLLPDLSNDKVFTFKAESYEDYALSDLFNDTSFITIPEEDQAHSLLTVFNLLAKPADIEDVLAEVKADLEADGFTVALEEGDEVVYELKNADDVATAMAIVFPNEADVEVEYIAHDNILDFETFAEALEEYNLQGTYLLNVLKAEEDPEIAFATSIPDYGTLLSGAGTQKGASIDLRYFTYYLGYYAQYGLIANAYLEVEFEYAENVTDASVYNSVLSHMTGSLGFEKKLFDLFGVVGYYNATTKEFVILDVEDGVLSFDILLLDAKSAEQVKNPWQSDEELLAQLNSAVASYNKQSADYFPASATLPSSFTVGEAEVIEWDFASTDKYMDYAIYYALLTFTYAEGTDMDAVVAGLTAALKELGYKDHVNPYFIDGYVDAEKTQPIYIPGLGNETTGEWVSLEVDGNSVVLTYQTMGFVVEQIKWVESRTA